MSVPFVAPCNRKVSDTTKGGNGCCHFLVVDIFFLCCGLRRSGFGQLGKPLLSLLSQTHPQWSSGTGLAEWKKEEGHFTFCPAPSRAGQGVTCSTQWSRSAVLPHTTVQLIHFICQCLFLDLELVSLQWGAKWLREWIFFCKDTFRWAVYINARSVESL